MRRICMIPNSSAKRSRLMFNPSRIRNDFAEAATAYDAHASLQQQVLTRLLEFAGPLPAQASVLDAGCGTAAFARLTGHKNITGIDAAYGMCQTAQANCRVAQADMSALPFADGAYDRVFSSLALQWVDDWRAALTECLRVVKPGGMLAFSTFVEGTLRELQESFAQIDQYAHNSTFPPAAEIQQFLQSTGYSVSIQADCIRETDDDLLTFGKRLKGLGAGNKHPLARKGLTTPRQWQHVEQYYRQHFSAEGRINTSWQVIWVKVQKP